MGDKNVGYCPSALEIFQYVNSDLPESQAAELKKHIYACEACSEVVSNFRRYMDKIEDGPREIYRKYEVPAHITELARQRSRKSLDAMQDSPPDKIAFGQLWSISAVGQADPENASGVPRIVVILSEPGSDDLPFSSVVVAPISLELDFLSQYDLAVLKEESPLGYQFMIELWNQSTTLVSQLRSYRGALADDLEQCLRLLNRAYLGLEEDVDALAGRIGWPILHESDPRGVFQAREIEECRYLREPALTQVRDLEMSGAESIHEIIHFTLLSTLGDGSLCWASTTPDREEVLVAAASEEAIPKSLCMYKKEAGYEVTAKFVLDIKAGELRLVLQRLSSNLKQRTLRVAVRTKYGARMTSDPIRAEEGQSIVIDAQGRLDQNKINEVQMDFT